ncbi:outer membrane beta-barrel protein [Mucilaginibacter sp. JRF]|uniref:type IX secretion system protein PorG n=1 Tax=Mucilaginibacter sp. JRF TaxID=2780088 RepID=UPI00187DF2A7|nr:DUF6089 family protein [Mucilaginibacter sp. JRF]MBE9584377.1 outer membrane beta-barrel protein [Mucilaginibacter sp. JRF]
MQKYLLTLLILFTTITLKAQTWEVGGGIGGAGYMGDLNQHNPVQISGLAGNLFFKRNFDGYLSAKLQFTYGKIGAADSTSGNRQQRDRNLSFSNRIMETSLIGEFNFMHYIPDAGKNVFTPFVFAGIGLASHAPRTELNGRQIGLRALRTEGQQDQYAGTVLSVPYGAGVKYNIGGKWTLIADLGYRWANTDYLDDVSGVYADKSALPNQTSVLLSDRTGERTGTYTGTAGTQRGDFRKRDTYLFLNLSISFTFVTEKCYYQN